jgi:hypothetical protein
MAPPDYRRSIPADRFGAHLAALKTQRYLDASSRGSYVRGFLLLVLSLFH